MRAAVISIEFCHGMPMLGGRAINRIRNVARVVLAHFAVLSRNCCGCEHRLGSRVPIAQELGAGEADSPDFWVCAWWTWTFPRSSMQGR